MRFPMQCFLGTWYYFNYMDLIIIKLKLLFVGQNLNGKTTLFVSQRGYRSKAQTKKKSLDLVLKMHFIMLF